MEKTVKKIKKTDLSITVILVIGIAVVINFFSYQLFLRFDLTENKVYSISDVSKEAVKSLDDIVSIKAYFSSNLPSQLLSTKQEVVDILDEYQAFSNGNIRIEYVDPKDDETLQRELQMKGIPQLQFNVIEKDQAQVVNGYMGLEINYSDNIEIIPVISSNIGNFEYQITMSIKKVLSDEMAVVGFLSSHDTIHLDTDLTFANQVLSELYIIEQVTLSEESPEIPMTINTLVIPGAKGSFNDEQQKAINSFIARGGSLLVLIDGVNVDIQNGLVPSQNTTGLEELLAKYGVKVNKDLVADMQSGMISYRQGNLPLSITVQYPLWPRIIDTGFNKDENVVANLHDVMFPWVSSLEVDTEKLAEDDFSYLVSSSEKSWLMKENYTLMPRGIAPNGATQSEQNLAVMVNKGIVDAYADDVVLPGRIAVVGDADFIHDSYVKTNAENLTLFQNLVDGLSIDSDLINIRSKIASSRPIKQDLEDNERALIRYLNVFGITLIVVVFGLSRYFLRRRSKFIDEL